MSPPLVFRRILRFFVESPGFPPVNGNERERTGTNGNEPCNQPALGASLAKVTIFSTSPYKQLIINVVCVCVLLSLSLSLEAKLKEHNIILNPESKRYQAASPRKSYSQRPHCASCPATEHQQNINTSTEHQLADHQVLRLRVIERKKERKNERKKVR